MNKKLPVLILTGALACAVFSPALAAEKAPALTPPAAYVEEVQTLPNSVLYYGTLKEIVRDEDGFIFQLYMDSEQFGEYVMNISEQTAWIDSANHTAADPAALQEGQSLYVFHSPIATLSLPPQSAAFAVVTNLPMDAQSAQLHKVEEVSLQDGQLQITTDNGELYITADQNTVVSAYGSDAAAALEDVQPGRQVIAWYSAVAQSYPGQAYTTHLMLLPEAEQTVEDSEAIGSTEND